MGKNEVNITVGLKPEVNEALAAQAEANGRAAKREAEKLIERGLLKRTNKK
ncbi:MAG: hypothetical protein IKL96_07360 [Kiritimatiellae bacterium]|nr:hypothetical protein [Kiritimatiellia bacterium]